MTLEDLGNIGEFTAAIATLFTLVYLALQIRLNTRETQAASRTSVSQAFADLLSNMSRDSETSKLLRRGFFDPDSLSADDTFRFDMTIAALFQNFETAFAQRSRSALTEEDWVKWTVLIKQYMAQPGVQAFWSRSAEAYTPAFRRHVEDLGSHEIYGYAFGEQPAAEQDAAS